MGVGNAGLSAHPQRRIDDRRHPRRGASCDLFVNSGVERLQVPAPRAAGVRPDVGVR